MWFDSKEKIHAPEIGSAWINSPGLTTRQLRGRAVLVDFWDYTCVNCLRTLPYVKEWHRRYHPKGLPVIGVHAPEFTFARTAKHVMCAAQEHGLEYPIVLDNEYQVWQSYSNRCWPAKYLIDKDGYVRTYHFGEGDYLETENAIQQLLREIDPRVVLPAPMEPVREADQPGARCYRVTPELYLGFERGRLGNESGFAANEVKDYQARDELIPDRAHFDGPWFVGRESIEACPLDGRPSRILLRYTAAEVNLVMSPHEGAEALVRIRQDGVPLAAEDASEDVCREGEEAVLRVTDARMYRLVKNRRFGSKLLELSTSTPGLEAYAFTFVPCVQP